MNIPIARSGLAVLALCGALVAQTALPASANTTTTRDIIYGAAAAAVLFTAYNVEHKHQVATTVVGYLPDGSTVYKDGHVVSPNGVSWYPSSQGETVACNGQSCVLNGNGYNGYGYNGYNGYGNYGSGYNSQYQRPNNDNDGDDNGQR